jgi:hypothetical protein
MADIRQLLSALEHGDPHAASRLLPLVYGELRVLALTAKVDTTTPIDNIIIRLTFP